MPHNNNKPAQPWWIVTSASVGAGKMPTIYFLKCIKCGGLFKTNMIDAVDEKCPNCVCDGAA